MPLGPPPGARPPQQDQPRPQALSPREQGQEDLVDEIDRELAEGDRAWEARYRTDRKRRREGDGLAGL